MIPLPIALLLTAIPLAALLLLPPGPGTGWLLAGLAGALVGLAARVALWLRSRF